VARQGNTILLAGEGAAFLGPRVIAWKLANRWPVDEPAGLSIFDGAFSFAELDDVRAFIEEAREREPRLVTVDTAARYMAGLEENSAKDVGLFVRSLDLIRTELGCAVLVLWHANKAGEAERGSSAMRGAADAMMALERVNDKLTLTPDKAKDSPLGCALELELSEVPGSGSVVLRLAGNGPKALTADEGKALRALRDSFPDGAKATELKVASNISERTSFRVAARLAELGLAQKVGPVLRLTDYGRLVANRGYL
jgi:hypothetical protein